ncbi:hypothetical protein RBH94_14280 [Aestuariibaculum sp. YM273]|uniref:hypothetical protein n=1 Tax=Aestuariibaculum sp. YM273 TaxID=3070659 RepID=UPI0027DD5892|nr:hypothetical protein [Aestuariibaculum sp. YM273]WMI65219.1 hypothetical protein RBH94_14280 [Aestuariibaculum sp. YM273]
MIKRGLILIFLLGGIFVWSQPYSGTIFIDPDIITSKDSSAFKSIIYKGKEFVKMYDRRIENVTSNNAFQFDIIWKDGFKSLALVNSEFNTPEAALKEAKKYSYIVGQLPHCLRLFIDKILIHKGVKLFGGGNRSILIHTGQGALYERDGILEETLVHEACHTSLDEEVYNLPEWETKASSDREFISTYAKDNPLREDVAESFLPWLMVRFRSDRITNKDFYKISNTIPNRLKFFDGKDYNLYPFQINSDN